MGGGSSMQKTGHNENSITLVVRRMIARCISKPRLLLLILIIAHLASTATAQWVQLAGMSENVVCLGSYGSKLYAGVDFGGPYRSTDNGSTWFLLPQGLPYEDYFQRHFFYPTVYSLTPSGPKLYAGTFRGVFVSTDSGATWIKKSSGITSETIKGIIDFGTTLCAATDGGGVFVSTNAGESWTAYNVGLTNATVRTIIRSGSDLFAGTGSRGYPSLSAGVFRSHDQGTTWSSVSNGLGSSTNVVNCLVLSGTTLFAGTDGSGVYVSTNNGDEWHAASNGVTDPYVYSIAAYGTTVFAGTSGGGFYYTNDFGTTWIRDNTGLTSTEIDALMVVGPYIYAGTSGLYGSPGGKVFRRALSELVTSVEGVVADVPHGFTLHQNYPNPFNPSTSISFDLPRRSIVSLKVFDALGREVAVLVTKELAAGTYSRQWNAAGLPSGVYFYQIQAGAFVETRKLIRQK